MNRYQIWKQKQTEAQAEIWTDPAGYYFCNIVAVSPDAQGKGIGKKLFDVVTRDMADKEGVKCYLESSKSVPNVDIYRRMGFQMVKELECRDGDDVCMVCLSIASLSPFLFFTDFSLLFISYTVWFASLRRRVRRCDSIYFVGRPILTYICHTVSFLNQS